MQQLVTPTIKLQYMEAQKIVEFISKGCTDFIFQLLKLPNWKEILNEGQVKPLQWLVHYDDNHGQGWGNGMDWKLFGEYLPE